MIHTQPPLPIITHQLPYSANQRKDSLSSMNDTITGATEQSLLLPSPCISDNHTVQEGDASSSMRIPTDTHLRRKSSHIERWLDDQHRISALHLDGSRSEESIPSIGTKCHPYLAYPHLSVASLVKSSLDERSPTIESFVLVDDVPPILRQDASVQQSSQLPDANHQDETPRPSPPSTPRKNSPFRPTHHRFQNSSPLRGFHLAFGSRRSLSASRRPHTSSSSPSSAHPRTTSGTHSRGSSLSTLYALGREREGTPSPDLASTSRSQSTWRFKRPSVLEHFTATPLTSESNANASPSSRPSLSSSSMTHSSATSCRTSIDTPSGSRRKLNVGSIRSQSPTLFPSATPSLWSLPTNASHMYDPPDSTKVLAKDRDKPSAVRIPLSLKSAGGNSFGSVSAALGSQRTRKKRKLIISEIPRGDERRFAAARRWCESFGELSQFTRAPNGDVLVDFRRAEVAETVCRLNARVYITGVGSVCLSYYTGKKP